MSLIQSKFSAQDIFRSGLAYAGGTFLGRAIAALTSFFVIYHLTVYEYGVFHLILALIGIFQIVLLSGIDTVVRNDIAIDVKKGNESNAAQLFFELVFLKLTLTLLTFSAFWLSLPILERYYGENMAFVLGISSFLILTGFVSDTFSIFFRSIAAIGMMSKLNVLAEVIRSGFIIFAFTTRDGGLAPLLIAIVFAQIFGQLFYLFASFSDLRRWWGMVSWRTKQVRIFHIMKTYGKWGILSNMSSSVLSHGRDYVIKFMISTEAVGYYHVARAIFSNLVSLFPLQKVIGIFLPYKIGKNDLKPQYFTNGVKFATIFFAVLLLCGYVGGTILILLFFPKYAPSLPVLYVMLPALLVGGLSVFTKTYLHTLREQKVLFWRGIFKDFISFALLFLFVPFFGLVGLGLEYLFAAMFTSALLYTVLKRQHPEFSLQWKHMKFTKEEIKYLHTKFYSLLKNKTSPKSSS